MRSITLFASSLQFWMSFESNSNIFSLYMENKVSDPSVKMVSACDEDSHQRSRLHETHDWKRGWEYTSDRGTLETEAMWKGFEERGRSANLKLVSKFTPKNGRSKLDAYPIQPPLGFSEMPGRQFFVWALCGLHDCTLS